MALTSELSLVPEHKSDLAAVQRLLLASKAQVAPLVPDLLEWLQDINWPVAPTIAEVLHAYPDELITPVQSVLRGDDDVWKYWTIVALLVEGPAALREAVADDVARILNTPTKGELEEEVHLVARDVIFVMSYVDE